MNPILLSALPTLDTLQSRFSFIDNETLRGNVTIYFRYIIFLLAISEDEQIDSLKYTVYKDIIIFTASIVESILEYSVRKYVVEGKTGNDVFGFATKYVEAGAIHHECDDLYHAKLVVVKKTKSPEVDTGDEISFNDIIKAAKNAGILDEALKTKADKLRELRNTIHLQSLRKSSDDYFKKADVEKAFKNAHDIILRVEAILTTS